MHRLSGRFWHPTEEMRNASVEDVYPPRRDEKILRNFDLLLPKFHFILSKFYFTAPWRIFISSVAIWKFLRGGLKPPVLERHFSQEPSLRSSIDPQYNWLALSSKRRRFLPRFHIWLCFVSTFGRILLFDANESRPTFIKQA